MVGMQWPAKQTELDDNFFHKQSVQEHWRLSLLFGNSSNNRHRAAERLANLKKRTFAKLATAPAEIYAMIRGEYKENPTVSALQHSSGHMVTGKAAVEEVLMDKWRSEVFDLPPSAATPEFRETFLQSPPKQAKDTAKLMADVTADEVRDVARALNSKAAVIGLPLHFFTHLSLFTETDGIPNILRSLS